MSISFDFLVQYSYLLLLFATITLIIGKRINLVNIPGFPTSRISLIRRFIELDGFEVLLAHYVPTLRDAGWNSENVAILLRAMSDVSFPRLALVPLCSIVLYCVVYC